jgi:transcriptional accessory protein Tex/SPT6
VYAPYRPKRRTRATIAREAGLEPLADQIFNDQASLDPAAAATSFVNPEKQVADVAAALSGARDILAERVSEDAMARARLRELYWKAGTVRSKVIVGKETEGAKFKDYFDWTEPVDKIPSHRLLAIRRGEEEGILLVRVTPPEDEAIALLEPLFVKAPGKPAGEQVRLAVVDSYKRLLGFAIEGEVRLGAKQKADTTAIRVFADNLRELLLAPPWAKRPSSPSTPDSAPAAKPSCSIARANSSTTTSSTPPPRSQNPRSAKPAKPSGPRPKVQHRSHRHRQRHRQPRNRAVRPRPEAPRQHQVVWSTKAAPPSTPPAKSPARSSPTRTSPSAARSASAAASWIRSPNW